MKKYVLAMLLLCRHLQAQAQFAMFDDTLLMQKFHYSVKQVAEFMDRFNFREPVTFGGNNVASRQLNLTSLFNLADTALTQNPSTLDFLKIACKDAVRLRFRDTNWQARVACTFLYQGKTIQATIILKTETNPGGGSWVIHGIQSEVLNFSGRLPRSVSFIDPVDEEVGFIGLSRALNAGRNILSYTAEGYTPDMLSVFLFLVQDGAMRLKQINALSFWFYQVPGWVFIVKDFNRAGFNSGWLISHLEKTIPECVPAPGLD